MFSFLFSLCCSVNATDLTSLTCFKCIFYKPACVFESVFYWCRETSRLTVQQGVPGDRVHKRGIVPTSDGQKWNISSGSCFTFHGTATGGICRILSTDQHVISRVSNPLPHFKIIVPTLHPCVNVSAILTMLFSIVRCDKKRWYCLRWSSRWKNYLNVPLQDSIHMKK